MHCQGILAKGIQAQVGIFRDEATFILGKNNVQRPMHTLYGDDGIVISNDNGSYKDPSYFSYVTFKRLLA